MHLLSNPWIQQVETNLQTYVRLYHSFPLLSKQLILVTQGQQVLEDRQQ